MHPTDYLLVSVWIGYLYWRMWWTPTWLIPPKPTPPPIHKARIYRLDDYQRRIDRRGRPEQGHVVRRIKR